MILRAIKSRLRKMRDVHLRRRELRRLTGVGDETAIRLAQAIRETADRSFTQAETDWMDAIETLRSKVAASEESISYSDFGAGEPADHYTPEEMAAGTPRTNSLARLCQQTSKRYPWSHLLLKLVRTAKPTACLEMGTCLGFSAAYLTAALEMNGEGKLITLEGAAPLAELAGRHLATLELDRVEIRIGRFQDTLDAVLREAGPFGFAFIDGHHDGDATVAYFEQILPSLTNNAVVVFDDILWYESMQTAWRQIASHANVRIAVDLGVMGICVVSTSVEPKHSFRFKLP